MFSAPVAPMIIPEECNAENNSVTVAWQPPSLSHVEGYVLELDDGNGGDFRVSKKTSWHRLFKNKSRGSNRVNLPAVTPDSRLFCIK